MAHMIRNDPPAADGTHGNSAHGAYWRWLSRPLARLVVAMRASMASNRQSWPMAKLDEHLLRDIWPDTDGHVTSRDRIDRPRF